MSVLTVLQEISFKLSGFHQELKETKHQVLHVVEELKDTKHQVCSQLSGVHKELKETKYQVSHFVDEWTDIKDQVCFQVSHVVQELKDAKHEVQQLNQNIKTTNIDATDNTRNKIIREYEYADKMMESKLYFEDLDKNYKIQEERIKNKIMIFSKKTTRYSDEEEDWKNDPLDVKVGQIAHLFEEIFSKKTTRYSDEEDDWKNDPLDVKKDWKNTQFFVKDCKNASLAMKDKLQDEIEHSPPTALYKADEGISMTYPDSYSLEYTKAEQPDSVKERMEPQISKTSLDTGNPRLIPPESFCPPSGNSTCQTMGKTYEENERPDDTRCSDRDYALMKTDANCVTQGTTTNINMNNVDTLSIAPIQPEACIHQAAEGEMALAATHSRECGLGKSAIHLSSNVNVYVKHMHTMSVAENVTSHTSTSQTQSNFYLPVNALFKDRRSLRQEDRFYLYKRKRRRDIYMGLSKQLRLLKLLKHEFHATLRGLQIYTHKKIKKI